MCSKRVCLGRWSVVSNAFGGVAHPWRNCNIPLDIAAPIGDKPACLIVAFCIDKLRIFVIKGIGFPYGKDTNELRIFDQDLAQHLHDLVAVEINRVFCIFDRREELGKCPALY